MTFVNFIYPFIVSIFNFINTGISLCFEIVTNDGKNLFIFTSLDFIFLFQVF